MATVAQPVEQQDTAVLLERHRFNVDEYYKMLEAGILSEDDRVELVEGEIVDMAPIGVPHAQCVNRLTRLFSQLLLEEVIVQVQNPIRLNQQSEVQPDLALLKLRDYSRDQQHPGPEDVLLVIEVSDTTLVADQREKVPLYARSDISEVWIVNLPQELLEIYSQPQGGAYQITKKLKRGQSLKVLSFADVQLRVEEVVGEATT